MQNELTFNVDNGKWKKSNRVTHDTTAACQQGKGENVEISRKKSPFWVPIRSHEKNNLKTNLF